MTLIVSYFVSLISTSGLNWSKIMSAKSSLKSKFKIMLLQKWLDCDLTRKIWYANGRKYFTQSNRKEYFNTIIKWFNLFQIYRHETWLKETVVVSDSPNSIHSLKLYKSALNVLWDVSYLFIHRNKFKPHKKTHPYIYPHLTFLITLINFSASLCWQTKVTDYRVSWYVVKTRSYLYPSKINTHMSCILKRELKDCNFNTYKWLIEINFKICQ